ncbi:MAG: hypothetical protein U5K75_04820 [Ahrensia sp.]|nr:hypothetical protein [Ahrensia sp.]
MQKLLTKTANLSAVGLTVLAISVALQFNFSALTRPFASEKTFLDASWTDGPINSIANNPDIRNKTKSVFVRNWARGAKLGHAFGPHVEINSLSDPRHFQFQTMTQPESQYLIDFIAPDHQERAQEILATIAKNSGLKITGETTILAEKAGSIVRFYIAIVPVERN